MKTLWTVLALSPSLSLVALATQAQDSTPPPTGFDITVNSAADGAPIADDALTLREAIAIANGCQNGSPPVKRGTKPTIVVMVVVNTWRVALITTS